MKQLGKKQALFALALLLPAFAMMGYSESKAPRMAAVSAYAAEAESPAEPAQEAPEIPERPELTLDAVRAVRFADVPETDRLADAVSYAACRGMMIGGYNNEFAPHVPVTRGQTLTVLRRLALDTGVLEAAPEDDLQWAIDADIMKGTEKGYEENESVTRAQMMTFLHRYAQLAGFDMTGGGDLSRYPDAAEVPEYARTAFEWAEKHGLLRDLAADGLCCELPLSRKQVAALVTAVLGGLNGETLADEITAAAAEDFASDSRANHDKIQAYVDSAAQKYGAIGLQVAVIENGHVTDTFAYGWATKKSDPMTAEHKLRIASISKIVLGMTAMRMRQDGLIDLDAPFGEYWGETFRNPYYPKTPVTIRSIMTHTSSLPMMEASEAYRASTVRSRQRGSGGYSHVVPGSMSSWGYNNYAFGVLGLTLELAGGKTVDQMLNNYFFDTLGIDASFYGGDVKNAKLIATIYEHGGGVGRSVDKQRTFHAGAPGTSGSVFAGGLVISAHDLAKLVAVLASDGEYEGVRLMSAESVALMESHGDTKVSDGFYQCLPLRYRTNIYGRDALYYHTGSAYGVYNCMSYDPVTGDGVVVLTSGASAAKDAHGIYAVCGSIQNYIYGVTK